MTRFELWSYIAPQAGQCQSIIYIDWGDNDITSDTSQDMHIIDDMYWCSWWYTSFISFMENENRGSVGENIWKLP